MTTPQQKFFGPDYPEQDLRDNQDCWLLADFNHKLILNNQ